MTSSHMISRNISPTQTPTGRANRRPDGQHAFTLIEMMMAMTITATLLAAVGAAMDASMNSYSENEKFSSATQLGRSFVSRMTREARTCADLDSTGNTLTITPPPSTDPDDPIRIVYMTTNGILIRHVTTSTGDSVQTLLGGPGDGTSVDTFIVIREDDAAGLPVSITVRLILGVRDRTFAVTSSAALRTGQFQ